MNSIISGLFSIADLSRFSKKKKLEELRALWGKPIERISNFGLIENYHKLKASNSDGEYVDDKTWADLNFDSIYSFLDRNISGPGRQYLYHLMHKYEDNEEVLNKRYELISYFRMNPLIREKVQLALQRLKSDDTYFIISLLLGEKPLIPKYPFLIYFSSILSVVVIACMFYNSTFLFAVLFMSALNLVITKVYSSKIYDSFIGFFNLSKLIISAYDLEKIGRVSDKEEFLVLKRHSSLLRTLSRRMGHLIIDKTNLDPFIQSVIEYLNMFCLFDLVAYTRSVIKLYQYKKEFLEIFEAIANLDASISVASYIEEIPYFSKAEFTGEKSVTFEDVYHPLIKEAIANSISDMEGSALITGSNMAGKTTFIKCIGVNVILSRTLKISLSRKALIPKLIVKSSIKIEDNIESSKSYYFTEVEELHKLVKLSLDKNKYLFLIDEIFRGTNTIERLGASAAVLKQLNENNMVLVTTHDIELQELLDNTYKMYHFNEQVDGSHYYFDYKIKDGPCSSGNAIKLLEIMGYPENITREANFIAKSLLKGQHNLII